jgi:hypothetical protein
MSRSPPLRFLILLLAGWSAMRAALLAPGWWATPADAGARPARIDKVAEAERRTGPPRSRPTAAPRRVGAGAGRIAMAAAAPRRLALPAAAAAKRSAPHLPAWTEPVWKPPSATAVYRRQPQRPLPGPADPRPAAAAPRWSLTAWSFLRRGDAAPLAAGGTLGGSQAGARLAYRLNRDSGRPLALALRLTAPVRRPAAAEAALGLDWQPSRRVPVHLLAERRQKLGPDGRSAFGLTVYGGLSDAAVGRLIVDAYAQAGIVGARSRDRFADGALRLSLPLGRARLGVGAWAAAQPAVARLDLGPQASLRLPLAGRNVTLTADWRQRVAGNARPSSGPTLTFATDF